MYREESAEAHFRAGSSPVIPCRKTTGTLYRLFFIGADNQDKEPLVVLKNRKWFLGRTSLRSVLPPIFVQVQVL